MVKMIFSDFDNTMLQIHSDKNTFDKYQVNILKKVREAGISFSIVTGRCIYFFLNRFPELLEYVDYIIASNGSVIYDVRNDKFIYKNLLSKSSLEDILKFSFDNNYDVLLNCLKEQYSEDLGMDQYFSLKNVECEQVVVKFKLMDLNFVLEMIRRISNVVVNNVSIRGEDCAIDVNCSGISKGNSIVWLCNQLGVSLEDTVGFGDGENDLSVFEVVGKSVAVLNAGDNIQKKCDDVTLECSKDGIFHYIEDNILK